MRISEPHFVPHCPPPVKAAIGPRTGRREAPDKLERTRGFGPSYWCAIHLLADTAAFPAASFVPLREPGAAWAARLTAIDRARTAIYGPLYGLYPDERGFAFLRGLIGAAKRGVDVCISIDANAQRVIERTGNRAARAQFRALITELESIGGHVLRTASLRDQLSVPGGGHHMKALVIDHAEVIYGGRNIGEPYYGTWTDFDAALTGPVVRGIGIAALKVLHHASGGDHRSDSMRERLWRGLLDSAEERKRALDAASGPKPVFTLIGYDPVNDPKVLDDENRVTLALVLSVERAEREIWMTSNYVHASDELREALIAAAKRGVAVHLVTTSEAGSKVSKLPYYLTEAHYGDLLAAGCHIHEARAQEHGKMYVIDDRVGAFGSYNLSKWSHARNGEALLFTADAGVIAELKRCIRDTICTRSDRLREMAPAKLWRRFLRFVGRVVA